MLTLPIQSPAEPLKHAFNGPTEKKNVATKNVSDEILMNGDTQITTQPSAIL